MSTPLDAGRIADILLTTCGLEVVNLSIINRLWADYGYVCAMQAQIKHLQGPASHDENGVCLYRHNIVRLVMKVISPPPYSEQEGHLRKMFSYEVEQYFYDKVVPLLPKEIATARSLTSSRKLTSHPDQSDLHGSMAIVLTDLRVQFPVHGGQRSVLASAQVYACIKWLANFHKFCGRLRPNDYHGFLLPPLAEAERVKMSQAQYEGKLWLNGGYTYLATRRDEYHRLQQDSNSEWSIAFCQPIVDLNASIGEMAAQFLVPRGRSFETYIHGDVKSDNIFFTETGNEAAFFDFQYVGLGLGVCDLAKFFTCCVPKNMLTSNSLQDTKMPLLQMTIEEKSLLKRYLKILQGRPEELPIYNDWINFQHHWETALVDWCRFQASWGFWGNTAWLQARVRYILHDENWKSWLYSQTQPTVQPIFA